MKSIWNRSYQKKQDKIKFIIGIIALVVLLPLFVWGMANLGKYLSYELWYKDMVIETVQEMVKESALKGGQ